MTAPRTHLIYSDYWGRWHRRSVDREGRECATGYTDDILHAGIFTEAFAKAYDDGDHPGARDRAVPLESARRELAARLAHVRQSLEEGEAALAALDARLKGEDHEH